MATSDKWESGELVVTTSESALTVRRVDVLAIIDANPKLAESTKRQYKRAVENYLATGGNLADAGELATYANTLSKSSRSFLKAALRLLAKYAATMAKGSATPENVDEVTAVLYRSEALQEAVEVEQTKGRKAGNWLAPAEVKRLRDTCGAGIEGKRDRAVLGLMVSAGLRRAEAAALRFEDVKLQPVTNGSGQTKMRAVLDVTGKGAKARTVPISDSLAAALDDWGAVVGGTGRIARALGRNREPNGSMSTVAIFHLVRRKGAAIGKPGLAPHDLRRTWAQIGYDAGIPLTQLSALLGHSSVATTQKYLNLEVKLDVTVSDFVPF